MWQEDLQKAVHDYLKVKQLGKDADARTALGANELDRGIREFCESVIAGGGTAVTSVEEDLLTVKVDLDDYHWERSVKVSSAPDAYTVHIIWYTRGGVEHADEWKVELKEVDLLGEKVASRFAQLLTLDMRTSRR